MKCKRCGGTGQCEPKFTAICYKGDKQVMNLFTPRDAAHLADVLLDRVLDDGCDNFRVKLVE